MAGGDDATTVWSGWRSCCYHLGINLMVRLNQMDASLAEVSHELITLTALLLLYGSLATRRLLAKKGTEGIKS
ncbi:hypothetical protein [Stenotrophomonas sp. NRRL B-14846]|uniref:hypothetical protein n=1 Tax=Stenotrophomonas sp. NRRL B-14846 TaxID=3162882 RepID=UPI003D2B8B76